MKLNSILNKQFVIFSIIFLSISCTKNDKNKASLPAEVKTEKKGDNAKKKTAATKETITPKEVAAPPKPEQNSTINTSLDSESVPRIPAYIKAENQSSIGFSTSGAITHIYFRAGEEVKQGQILASIEDNQAAIEVRTAKIDVSLKKLALEQQEKNTQRIEKQYKSGIVNLATYEKEKNTLESKNLEYQSAQSTLAGKEFILKSTKILAPYTGVITKVEKSVGDYVSTGTAVFQITQNKNYKLYAQIPITYFNQLKVGMKLEVRNPNTGHVGEAVIKRVVPVIDATSKTFDVYADVTSFNDKLAPGVFLEIKLKSK